jgi:large subunit ribosomal protein MRP49
VPEITLTLDNDLEISPIREHQPVEFACAAQHGARLTLSVDGQALEPFLRPGETIWRWSWNPGAAVGLHRLALVEAQPNDHESSYGWALRVVTRKLDQERYQALLEDIQRAAYGLLVTLSGAGSESADLQREAPWRHSPAEEYYSLFENHLAAFERAVRRIAMRPREQLRGRYEAEPLGQAAELGAEALADLVHGPFDEAPPEIAPALQEVLRSGGGLLPRSITAEHSRPTTDIYEHRLLKHMLALLLRRARFVGRLAEREAARLVASELFVDAPSTRRLRADQIAAGCAAAVRTLRDLYGLPFLAQVRPLPAFRGATPLLQRDAAYREVYRMWQALRQHPYIAFDSLLFAIPIADLPYLYEGWCAIQVAQALLALGGTVREQRLAEPRQLGDDDLELTIALAEQVPLLVIERGDWTLFLRYQPRYRSARSAERRAQDSSDTRSPLASLDRHIRVPDLAIEVRQAGAPPRALLLDAKYRLDADGRGVPQDALADAYTYFGAIGYAGQRATIGALILYPGTGAPERYPSGVGTIPLLPGSTKRLAEQLAEWLQAS